MLEIVNLTDQYWAMVLQSMLLLFLLGVLAGTLFGRWWANGEWLDMGGTNELVRHRGYIYRVTRECDEQGGVDKADGEGFLDVGRIDLTADEVQLAFRSGRGRHKATVEAGADPIYRVVPAREGRGHQPTEDEYPMGVESWRG